MFFSIDFKLNSRPEVLCLTADRKYLVLYLIADNLTLGPFSPGKITTAVFLLFLNLLCHEVIDPWEEA